MAIVKLLRLASIYLIINLCAHFSSEDSALFPSLLALLNLSDELDGEKDKSFVFMTNGGICKIAR